MHSILKFFDSNLKVVVSPLFGVNYLIGLSVSFFVIISLFIFKSFYSILSKYNGFRYTLGIFQLFLYILYFTFHQVSGDITWRDYMPFQLCSFLDLTSAFLLLFPTEKLFSITFPLVGPVILAFLLPDVSKQVYGLNNFFFYQYYLNHLIIFFSYFYLYFYGHVKYNRSFLKQTCSFITVFALVVFVFNIVFGTNYLFIGATGFSFSKKHWILSTGNWNPIFRFLFIWLVGLIFVLLFSFLINKYAPPFYFNKGCQVNEYYCKKISFFNKLKNKLKKQKKSIKFIKINNLGAKKENYVE